MRKKQRAKNERTNKQMIMNSIRQRQFEFERQKLTGTESNLSLLSVWNCLCMECVETSRFLNWGTSFSLFWTFFFLHFIYRTWNTLHSFTFTHMLCIRWHLTFRTIKWGKFFLRVPHPQILVEDKKRKNSHPSDIIDVASDCSCSPFFDDST